MSRQYPSEVSDLLQLAIPRDDPSWLMAAEESALRFLEANETVEWVVIYAYLGVPIYLHSVLAPREQIRQAGRDELLDGFPGPTDLWRIEYSYGIDKPEDIRIFLDNPMADYPPLRGGEKLVFSRSWEGGGDDDRFRLEVNQKLVHSLDLHYVSEREAFCRLDRHGDIEDVIRIVRPKGADSEHVVVAIRRRELHEYATVADMAIVTHFDFIHHKEGDHDWTDLEHFKNFTTRHLFYRGGKQEGIGTFVIGRHVVIPDMDRMKVARRMRDRFEGRDEQGYATFKVRDLRSGALVKASCDPSKLGNYFPPDSGLPHELSPAFFRAEVLSKYKADRGKYTLTKHRQIICRSTWSLKSYDWNEVGQVYAYLVDLNKLPYEEQIYWRSFNEWPKGDISERSIRNDFMGEIDPSYDPLHSLGVKISELDRNPPDWWKPRPEELHQVVHAPPVTDSVDEWADAIMGLDQLVVEGLVQRALRERMTRLGRKFEKSWASLKLAEECLIGAGTGTEEAKSILAPLRRVHELRTKVRGHAASTERAKEAKTARKEHGTFRDHFKMLVEGCDESLATLIDDFEPIDGGAD